MGALVGPDFMRKERVDGDRCFRLENSLAIWGRILKKRVFRFPLRHGNKHFNKVAPDLGSSTRPIQRRISRYLAVDMTQQTGQKISRMWNYVLTGPLILS
jgi:hypothetical protein